MVKPKDDYQGVDLGTGSVLVEIEEKKWDGERSLGLC